MVDRKELFKRFGKLFELANRELDALKSDRATVVIGGGIIDECVTETLRLYLAECDETEKLIDPLQSGPLSTFAAKVRLSVALGLLPQDEARDCLDLAYIRNLFAHHVGASFNDKSASILHRLEKKYRLPTKVIESNAGRYQSVCGQIAMRIAMRWSDDLLDAQRQLHTGGGAN